MKARIYKRGILNRVYNLLLAGADRRNTRVIEGGDLRIGVYDQLTIEYNGYCPDIDKYLDIRKALETQNFIKNIGYNKTGQYFVLIEDFN